VAPTAQHRTYVLDTCVLLADPVAPLRFEEHEVVLPLVVIEELDRQKARMDEVGANARRAIRFLEELGASRPGGLREPITLPSGGTLRIEPNGVASDRLPEILDPRTPDHRLLTTCLSLADHGTPTVLVTKDAALRIKGAQLGVTVQDYRADTVAVDESYSGVAEGSVDARVLQRWIGRAWYAGHARYRGSRLAALLTGPKRRLRRLVREVASRGITVNAVCPGFFETNALSGMSGDERKAAAMRIPMRRFGRPAEVAAAIQFLASDEASYITGSTLKVDGGVL